jgi:hypothetical protein
MSDKNMNAKVKVNFTKASTKQNITSGENISTSFGKISKYLDDLGSAAFTDSSDYATPTDLSNKVDKVTGKELMPSDLLDANGNVALSHLPDIVLGQMIYGGTVNASNVATLSTNAKTKLGTTSNTITLTNNTTSITGYVSNEGIYYIATGNATLANLGIKTGDWLLSTGSAWKKIDNTDEVSSVNSKTGAVTLNASDVNAVSTSANQGLTDTQKANARTNIGAGTSSFDGDYNSLSNPPTIPPAVAVKGNAETAYRTGNVNLTPANIGAATSAQGAKADSAVQTIKMNGNAVTKTSGVVDLGTVITAHQDISGKADKSATVSTVTYDTTNKKLTKTINGTTSDVVTTAQLKTDMALSKSDVGLGNVNNTSDLNKPISTATQAALDSQQEQIDYNTNNGVKNLLKITGVSATKNGVTFTVDKASGTITANGTATAPTSFDIYIDNSHSCPFNGYILTGCPTGGSGTTYDLRVTDIDRMTVVDYGSGREISVTNTGKWAAAILIRNGQTVSNLVFKPMIRDASIEDDTFQPYAKSNVELTQKALLRDDNNNLYYTGGSINEVNVVPASNMYLTSYGRADISGLYRAHLGSGTTDTPGYVAIDATNNSGTDAITIREDSSGNYISIDKDRIKMDATGGNALLSMWSKSFKLCHPNSSSSLYYSIECNENFGMTLSTSGLPILLHSPSYINLSSESGICFTGITMPYANNAGFHNSIYRGKGLGTSYTTAQKAQVQAGTFDDLFVGDYWTINGINWRIAHFDYYLNTGDTATTKHHLVIVPDTSLASSYMNATDVTTDAYAGSYMFTTTLLQDGTEASDSVFGKIKAAFGESNLLSIRQLFANAVDSNGNVSGWAWYNTRCFLMNQCMVYGHKAWANGNNDGYNVGIDKSQLALFAHNPTSINTKQTYWLRDVRSSANFAVVADGGLAIYYYASGVTGVRPVVLLS